MIENATVVCIKHAVEMAAARESPRMRERGKDSRPAKGVSPKSTALSTACFRLTIKTN